MQTVDTAQFAPSTQPRRHAATEGDCTARTQRGPGEGYGRSSGYASRRPYAAVASAPLFRCV